jgi:threonine/homoserine/homoserine lactone efflux protein
VFAALAVIIPLGLGGALSPVMLTEQTVLLARPDGGRAGVSYAAGVVLTSCLIVVAFLLFGHAISLPNKPHLDATLDLVLGLVLVSVAVLVLVSGRRRGGSANREGGDDRGASGSRRAGAVFALGVLAMATNFKTLALIAPATKEITRADVEIAAQAVLVLVLVGLVSMPAWVPVALSRVAPGPSQRGLAAVRDQIARRGRGVIVGLFSIAGLFFIGRGLIHLVD